MSSEEFSNPWGGPSERSLSTKTVDLLLRLVDSGRGLASLMKPGDPHRRTRVENLWKWHRKAESMLVFELGRKQRMAKKRAAEQAELAGMPFVDDEEDEEEEEEPLEEGFADFSF